MAKNVKKVFISLSQIDKNRSDIRVAIYKNQTLCYSTVLHLNMLKHF